MDRQGPVERDEFFDRFYEEQFPMMWKYALPILKNPAITEEVVQDAFVEVLRNLDYLMTCEKPEWWLRRTVKNKARHVLREKMRDMRRLVYLNAQDGDSIARSDELDRVEEEASDNVTGLKEKIDEVLSPEERCLLLLYLRKSGTYKELAKEAGLSVSACQKRVQRIRKKLEKIF